MDLHAKSESDLVGPTYRATISWALAFDFASDDKYLLSTEPQKNGSIRNVGKSKVWKVHEAKKVFNALYSTDVFLSLYKSVGTDHVS